MTVASVRPTAPMAGAPTVIQTRAIGDLREHPKNSNIHPPEQIDRLVASIDEFGWTFPILIDEKNFILSHTGMWFAAKKRGMSHVPVIEVRGWPESRKRAYIIADNKLAELSVRNMDMLGNEIAEFQATGFNVEVLGFQEAEIKAMMRRLTETPGDPEKIPATPVHSVTVAGDLWLLGEHRVYCGDATNEADVVAVLGDDEVALCLTDPPQGTGANYPCFSDTEEEVARLATLWLPIARAHAKVTVFVCGTTRQWLYPKPSWVMGWFYASALISGEWGLSSWQPLLCYGKDPSLSARRGRRADARSLVEHSQQWIDTTGPLRAGALDHPCPKPLSLWQWLFQRLTFIEGETVFDPFLGSGTAIIVAGMEHRCCAGLELHPGYCDVAIARWQDYTGREAIHGATGKTFAQMRAMRHGEETDRAAADRGSARAHRTGAKAKRGRTGGAT